MPRSKKLHYDYALISRMATHNHSEYVDKLKPAEREVHNQRAAYLQQQGWNALPSSEEFDIRDHEYFGVAYYKFDTEARCITDIVIGHRGTQFNQANLLADLQIAEKRAPDILLEGALPYFDALVQYLSKVDIRGIKIIHTGFSLGGFIAAAATANQIPEWENVYSVTFDAPGIDYLVSDSNKRCASKIINYVTSPNVVNTCNKHIGKVRQLKFFLNDSSPLPEKIIARLKKGLSLKFENPNTTIILMHTTKSHDMDKIIENIDKSKGLKYKTVTQWPTALIEPVYGLKPSLPTRMSHFGADNFGAIMLSAVALSVQGGAHMASCLLWEMTKRPILEGQSEEGITHFNYRRQDEVIYAEATPADNAIIETNPRQNTSVVQMSMFASATNARVMVSNRDTHMSPQTTNQLTQSSTRHNVRKTEETEVKNNTFSAQLKFAG